KHIKTSKQKRNLLNMSEKSNTVINSQIMHHCFEGLAKRAIAGQDHFELRRSLCRWKRPAIAWDNPFALPGDPRFRPEHSPVILPMRPDRCSLLPKCADRPCQGPPHTV